MRNVVLVCLDSVRRDYFAAFAPRLRERADVEYTQCRAASGWSVPSHASMFTGTLPHQHGIHVYNRDFSGLSRADTFLGRLPDHRAVGASANVYASDAFGFDGMFDDYVSVSPDRRYPEGRDVEKWGQRCDDHGLARYAAFVRTALDHGRPLHSLANGVFAELGHQFSDLPVPKPFDDGAKIVSRAARGLTDEEPFVMFTNFMDAHSPLTHVLGYDRSLHDAPLSWHSGLFSTHEVNAERRFAENERHIEHTRDLYRAAIDYLDRVVCDLVDRVRAETTGETTVIVTADHGENLGFDADDRLLAHKGVLTEGLLHVPLVVLNAPGDGDRVVDDYVSHLRLGDLVVGLANGERPDVTEERVAAERIGSNMAESATEEERTEWDRMIRVVYDGDDKYEWDSNGRRLRHRLDRARPNWQELAEEGVDPDRIAAYEAALFDVPLDEYKREAVAGSDDVEVDAATADRLRHLGYR